MDKNRTKIKMFYGIILMILVIIGIVSVGLGVAKTFLISTSEIDTFAKIINKLGAGSALLATLLLAIMIHGKRTWLVWLMKIILILVFIASVIPTVWVEVFPEHFIDVFAEKMINKDGPYTSQYIFAGLSLLCFVVSLIDFENEE